MFLPLVLVVVLGFGYAAASRCLRESDPVALAALSIGLGANGFLLAGNLLLHVLPMSGAAPLALALLAGAAALLLRKPRRPAPRSPWSRAEACAAAAALAVVLVHCTLGLSLVLEDDYWLYAPMIRLFGAGSFPPVNPFLPDVQLQGNYGRPLLIALLASGARTDFLATMTITTVILQGTSFLAFLALGRRYLASPGAAFLVAWLPFFATHQRLLDLADLPGLVQAYGNHLTLVSLDLALLVRVTIEALGARRRAPAVLAGLLLGVSALVYVTLFAALWLALLGLPLVRRPGNPRARRLGLRSAALILVLAGALAALQGGALADLVRRRPDATAATGAAIGTEGTDLGVSQRVSLRFPRDPFLHVQETGGRQVPIWAGEFLGRVGPLVWLAPLAWGWSALRRKVVPGLLSGFALVSGLTPAVVDLGRWNNEFVRFLFLAAVGGGAALPWLAQSAIRHARRPPVRWLLGAAVTAAVAWLSWPALERVGSQARTARERGVPGLLDPLAVLRRDAPETFTAADESAARWIGRYADATDRFLVRVPPGLVDHYAVASLVVLAGCPYAGGGTVFDSGGSVLGPAMLTEGFRARAFWRWPGAFAARALAVRWIVVDPATQQEAAAALAGDAAFRERTRVTTPAGKSRLVFEVLPGPPPPDVDPASVASWSGLTQRAVVQAAPGGGPSTLRVTLANAGPRDARFPPGTVLRYFLHDLRQRRAVNPLDQISVPVGGAVPPGGTLELDVPLVATPGTPVAPRLTLGDARAARVELPRTR